MRKIATILCGLSIFYGRSAYAGQEVCIINNSAQSWELNVNGGWHTLGGRHSGSTFCFTVDDNTTSSMELYVVIINGKERTLVARQWIKFSPVAVGPGESAQSGWEFHYAPTPNATGHFINSGLCATVPKDVNNRKAGTAKACVRSTFYVDADNVVRVVMFDG